MASISTQFRTFKITGSMAEFEITASAIFVDEHAWRAEAVVVRREADASTTYVVPMNESLLAPSDQAAASIAMDVAVHFIEALTGEEFIVPPSGDLHE